MFGDVNAQGRQHALRFARHVYIGRFCGVHHYTTCPLGPIMGFSTHALFFWVAQDAAAFAKILVSLLLENTLIS